MPTNHAHQKLPAGGAAREALREKGQFWTPAWTAEAMVAYALGGGSGHLFDPAVGEGAFLRAARAVGKRLARPVTLLGAEVDPAALIEARASGLSDRDLSEVEIRDFLLDPPPRRFCAIAANPPYIRHHRLPEAYKKAVRTFGATMTGKALDGRAGLHVYFLLRALSLLEQDGRLAFILPADTCEGVFAGHLWRWITDNYCLDAVVTFAAAATPFPGVDTNAVIFCVRRCDPEREFWWARVERGGEGALHDWMAGGFAHGSVECLRVERRTVVEGLETGLSREPGASHGLGPVLGDYVRAMRGIATGNNDFFFLTEQQAQELGIPDELLVRAIGRTRDVDSEEVNEETISRLIARGRPTLLLNLDDRPIEEFPETVRAYLRAGERAGVPGRPLIQQRRVWYRMEVRRVPPFLFAYLGRRNARFIRNRAGVLPLTCLQCLYPLCDDPQHVERLWQVLRHPETVANLARVGKSYGSGAIKVEPRALERLPLPMSVLRSAGLATAGLFDE